MILCVHYFSLSYDLIAVILNILTIGLDRGKLIKRIQVLWLLEAQNSLKLMGYLYPLRLRKICFLTKLVINEVLLLLPERVSFIILRKVRHRRNLSTKISMLARKPISILKILMILSSRTTCKRNPRGVIQTLSLPRRVIRVHPKVHSSGAAWMTTICQRTQNFSIRSYVIAKTSRRLSNRLWPSIICNNSSTSHRLNSQSPSYRQLTCMYISMGSKDLKIMLSCPSQWKISNSSRMSKNSKNRDIKPTSTTST